MTLFERNMDMVQHSLFPAESGNWKPGLTGMAKAVLDVVDLRDMKNGALEYSSLNDAYDIEAGYMAYDYNGSLSHVFNPASFFMVNHTCAINFIYVFADGRIEIMGWVTDSDTNQDVDFSIRNWNGGVPSSARSNDIYLFRDILLPDWLKYDAKKRFRMGGHNDIV